MNVFKFFAVMGALAISFSSYAQFEEKIEELATKNATKVAFQIAESGKESVPGLRKALTHKNLQIRQYAAAILCELDLKVCQLDLKKKLEQKNVSEKEKIFYASFLYSSDVEEGRDFLVELVEKEKNISALQTLVDAYDKQNLDLFFKLLKMQIPEQSKLPQMANQKRLVELCERGIRTVGTEENIKNLDSLMSRLN